MGDDTVLHAFERLLRESNLEYDWLEPGEIIPGEKWWPKGLDAWPLLDLAVYRKVYTPRSVLLVRPKSVEEVSTAIILAGEAGACLVPMGGGSGVLGASAPRGGCALLDLSGLDNITVYPDEMIVEAGAGALLSNIEREASKYDLTTALEPQSINVASLGGFISTLGAGSIQPGAGNIEDALLYVDVVLGDGSIVRLGDRKAVRGLTPFGLEHLPLGAEGTLGVVVGAGLRLRAKPRYMASATFRLPSVERGLEIARRLVSWNSPYMLRILDDRESGLLYGEYKPLLIVAYADDEDREVPGILLGKARRIVAGMGGEERSNLYREWYEKRYRYSELISLVSSMNLWFDTLEVQANWKNLPAAYRRILKALDGSPGVEAAMTHISHFYSNGGVLYYIFAVQQNPVLLGRAWRNALKAAVDAGAYPTHHHGIGLQKLQAFEGPRQVYCRVKEALDPQWILNSHGPPSRCRVGKK